MANYRRILVTGGAGFIGSNFIRLVLGSMDSVCIVNIDKLTYAGNLENLKEYHADARYHFVAGDIAVIADVQAAFDACEQVFGGPVDAVVHFAAESHVDRSIEDPSQFLRTNVMGTQVMLAVAHQRSVQRFLHVSTDEVYGSLGVSGAFSEESPLAPNSPYSASKAGSDLIARAYFHTYGFPVVTTRCSNNYGPYQFPEKLIPLMIANAVEDLPLPVYGDGLNVRDWVHVEDHCRGVLRVLEAGRPGEVYNIGGRAERTNLDVVRAILKAVGKPESLIRFVADRPGHDRRYAMDASKLERESGWKPRWTFEEGINTTVAWYLANAEWVSQIRSGAYRSYYEKMYSNRTDWMSSVAKLVR